jgi:Family of unknown function (DUF5906)
VVSDFEQGSEDRSASASGGSAGASGTTKKVFDIKEGRKSRGKNQDERTEKVRKPTPMEIIAPYVDSLCDKPSATFEMERKFSTTKMLQGGKILLEVLEKQVVTTVTKDEIIDEVVKHSHNTPGFSRIDPDLASKAQKAWRGACTTIEPSRIAVLRELSEPGYCWSRLPWDLTKAETPTFDELMGRISNATALMQWIGGLLEPYSDRQTYTWIFGNGGDGKGALARFLAATFGPSYAAEDAESANSRFWTHGLIGKRLVVFSDHEDTKFVTSGKGKSLTGGDLIRVEEKQGKVGSMTLNCFLMFLSQNKPAITGKAADTRRAICCGIDKLPEGVDRIDTEVYDQKLWSEGSGFLWKCREAYRTMKRVGRGFDLDHTILADIVRENEMAFDAFFDTYFEKVKHDINKIQRDQQYVSTTDFQTILKGCGRWETNKTQTPFKEWLDRVMGIKTEKIRLEDGSTCYRVLGMRLSVNGAAAVERLIKPQTNY